MIRLLGLEELMQELVDLPGDVDASFAEAGNFVAQSTAQRAKNKIRRGGRSGRVYEISGQTHQASAPGEPPANLTGALAESIHWTRMEGPSGSADAFVTDPKGATLEYGGFNESGRYIEPRPFFGPSATEAIAAARGTLAKRLRKRRGK